MLKAVTVVIPCREELRRPAALLPPSRPCSDGPTGTLRAHNRPISGKHGAKKTARNASCAFDQQAESIEAKIPRNASCTFDQQAKSMEAKRTARNASCNIRPTSGKHGAEASMEDSCPTSSCMQVAGIPQTYIVVTISSGHHGHLYDASERDQGDRRHSQQSCKKKKRNEKCNQPMMKRDETAYHHGIPPPTTMGVCQYKDRLVFILMYKRKN